MTDHAMSGIWVFTYNSIVDTLRVAYIIPQIQFFEGITAVGDSFYLHDISTRALVRAVERITPMDTGSYDTASIQPFSLFQNRPNPFNPFTTVRYGLPETGTASLVVYDVSGHLVRRLVDSSVRAGMHEATWDGTDTQGRPVASGVYLYRLTSNQGVVTRKMTLLR